MLTPIANKSKMHPCTTRRGLRYVMLTSIANNSEMHPSTTTLGPTMRHVNTYSLQQSNALSYYNTGV